MCRIAQFCDFMHFSRANLHFNPFSIRAHRCQMQCLIAVCFWSAQPVTQSIRMCLVSIGKVCIDLPTLHFRIFFVITFEYHSDGIDVVDFIERHLLFLHLVVDAIGTLDTCFYLILKSRRIEFLAHRSHKFFYNLFTLFVRLINILHYLLVGLRMFITECQILKFLFDFEQPQTMCQWSIDV